ncbi:hypothetical protein Q5530_19550 [Saccharothrix sp. BKS2]|uniref:hypothetical protein n=1 Tax=Saccharothrix sp. BKS2 TaxID=3064400 RepID=UPI0039EA163C
MTQRIPPIRPSDTAPLWRSGIGQLDSLTSPAEPPPPGSTRARRGLLLKGLGLLGVAVLSGLVWVLVKPSGETTTAPTSTSAPAGQFVFTKSPQVPDPLRDSDCASHAYGKTRDYLTSTPCQQLTRALYTTTTPDGATVYTSVSVVQMKTTEDATALKDLTNRNGTGNVNDLIKDGAVQVQGMTTLGNGGYASDQRDREVIIIESDTATHGANETEHNHLMKKISFDALRLATTLT